jgi:hypothetical protein
MRYAKIPNFVVKNQKQVVCCISATALPSAVKQSALLSAPSPRIKLFPDFQQKNHLVSQPTRTVDYLRPHSPGSQQNALDRHIDPPRRNSRRRNAVRRT